MVKGSLKSVSKYHPSNVYPSRTGVGSSTLVEFKLISMSSISLPPFVSKDTVIFWFPVHEAIPMERKKKAKIIKNFRINTPPNLELMKLKMQQETNLKLHVLLLLSLFSLILHLNL